MKLCIIVQSPEITFGKTKWLYFQGSPELITHILYCWLFGVGCDILSSPHFHHHGEAGHLWSLYRNAQLRYNSYSNKYDICTEFGSNDEGGSRYDRDEEDDENMEGTPPYPMPPLQATGEPEALALTTAASNQLELGPDVLMVGVMSPSPPSLHIQELEADSPMTITTNQLSSSPPHTQEPEANPPMTITTDQLTSSSPHTQKLKADPPTTITTDQLTSSPPYTQELEANPPMTATTHKLPVSAVHAPMLLESALDVLEGHLYTPLAHEEKSTDDLGDLLYSRFGYIGLSASCVDYLYPSWFNSWGLVCSSVSGHGLQCQESEHSPICPCSLNQKHHWRSFQMTSGI